MSGVGDDEVHPLKIEITCNVCTHTVTLEGKLAAVTLAFRAIAAHDVMWPECPEAVKRVEEAGTARERAAG